RLQATLEGEGLVCRPLHTSHAFHSPMMDPVIEPLRARVARVALSPPRIPILSTVTARWLSDEEATDPGYWARHARATVRFAEAVAELWREPARVLLEVGPRTTTATLARQVAQAAPKTDDRARQVAVSSLGDSA